VQTLEHLALLDALGLREGVAVVTKADLVPSERVADVVASVRDLLAPTSVRDVPVLAVSAATGEGLGALRLVLATLAAAPLPHAVTRGPARLAIDRAFAVRGRGVVVTGTARGAAISPGDRMRVLPDGGDVRVRGVQVHDGEVGRGPTGGRVALLVGGDGVDGLRRGQVLVAGASGDVASGSPTATRRLLVALLRPNGRASRPGDRAVAPLQRDTEARLHLGTDQADALVVMRGHLATTLDDGTRCVFLRTDRAIAAAPGDRFVLRQPPPAGLVAGGVVVDPAPPTSRMRLRGSRDRLARLVAAALVDDAAAIAVARLDLHGLLRATTGSDRTAIRLADDVRVAVGRAIREAVATRHATDPGATGMPLTEVREVGADVLRRGTGAPARDALAGTDLVLGELVAAGRLRRDGDVVAVAGHRPAAPDPARAAAMERLVAALDVAAPPALHAAANESGCPPDAVRELEDAGRIVVVEDDLAWSSAAWERLRDDALRLARQGPLTPAALRDATGTSRKYVMALLEELGRRGILTRTASGHVPGPRA
jgi:selenocysteine-specific elongation factor